MKKAAISLSALVFVLGFLALSGCGSSTSGPAASSSPAVSSSAAASAKPSASAAASEKAAPKVSAQVIEGATKEGRVVIYDDNPNDVVAKVMAVFQKRYPFIKEYDHLVQNNAGEMIARALMESKASAPTADVILTGAVTALPMIDAGYVRKLDATVLGFDSKLFEVADKAMQVRIAASINTIAWNTDLVPSNQAPRTWEALLDPKWKGKLGVYVRPNFAVDLIPKWGVEKSEEYLRKFMENKPTPVQSANEVPTKLAAGEYAVTIAAYHHVMQPKAKGAPLDLAFPDPVTVTPIDGFVTSTGKNPNAGQLLLAWLASPEGAAAYEQSTLRGNPWVPGTQTYELAKGKNVTLWDGSSGGERDKYMKLWAPLVTP